MAMWLAFRAKRWWNRRYPEWVAEIALRYLPVVDAIRARPPRGLMLEVGVNGSGLTTYLARPVVGVDCVMAGRWPALVRPVIAKGQALPFRDAAFEATVCMDTLEHVAPADRSRFVEELMRVTWGRLYLGCPMGPEAERQDRVLQRYYGTLHHGGSFPFLDEHVANGLPCVESLLAEIRHLAAKSGRSARVTCEPNLNLVLHRVLLRLWMRTDPFSYMLHRLAIVLVHVRRWLNVGSCYRQIVLAEFES